MFRTYASAAYDLALVRHDEARDTVIALAEKRSMGREGFQVYGDSTWHLPLARRTMEAMMERADETFYLSTVLAEIDGAYTPRGGTAA